MAGFELRRQIYERRQFNASEVSSAEKVSSFQIHLPRLNSIFPVISNYDFVCGSH
jgi:hypothetical protein